MIKPIGRYVDHFGPLSRADAHALKLAGYSGVCRYLCAKLHPDWKKGLTPEEVVALRLEGVSIVSNFEGDPTNPSYFTVAQAQSDANDALIEAQWIGQPYGTPIYFSVDYDAQPRDYNAIRAYFAEIVRLFVGKYAVGVYGSYDVLTYLSRANVGVTHYWQTIAWSYGKVFRNVHIYQDTVNTKVGSLSVDINAIYVEPGAWPVVTTAPKPTVKTTVKTHPVEHRYRLTVPNEFVDLQQAQAIQTLLKEHEVRSEIQEVVTK